MNTRSNRTYAISLMALSTAFIASSAAAAPQVTASATQGTAPLSVRFDASGAAQSVADVDATWDFGDANASMFVDGHASATAHGAIAAHVFERPGSYDVLLELRDESGGVERRTLSVTVSAPMRTLCVSQDSNFAGCPGGAARLTTSSLASAALQFAEYDEVLLCRGESWNLSSTLNVTSSISIGAYGACQAPDAHGICVNAPRLETSGSTAIDLNASSDVRLADLALSGPSCSSCGSGVTGAGVQNALLQRLRIDGFATGISFDTSSMTNRDLHVVGCDVGGAHASQITVAADGLVLLNNSATGSPHGPSVGAWHAAQAFIGHNIFKGGTASGGAASALVISAHKGGLLGGGVQTGGVVIMHNQLGAHSGAVVQIGASALLSGSVSDVLCDANRFFGLTAQSSVHTGIDANTGMLTARNNIFDANAAASVYAAVNAGLLSLDGSRVDLLNNTVFRLNGGGSVSLDGAVNLRLASSAVNNLVFAPGSHVPSIDLSGVVDLNGNLSAELDPFADSAGADLRLNLLSSAVGGGVSANVVTDFHGARRPTDATIDVGAVLAVAATGNGGAGTGGSSNGGTSSGGTASGGSGSGGTSSGGSSSGGGTNSGGSSSGGGTNSGGNGTGGASTGGNGTGGTSGGGTGGGAGGNGPGFGPAMDGADVSADPAGIGVVGPGIEAESPSGEANAGTDLDAGFDPSQQSGCSAAPSRNSKPSSWLLVAAAAVVAMGRKRHP